MTKTKSKPRTQKLLRGPALAVAAFNYIVKHPEKWDQRGWTCGTSHCYGGWVVVMGGKRVRPGKMHHLMTELIGVSYDEAWNITDGSNRLSRIKSHLQDYLESRNWTKTKLLPLPKTAA